MKKDNNFFRQFIKAIIDVKYYINFNKESVGRAILYLLFMSLLLGTIKSIRPIYDYNYELNKASQELQKNNIDFYLKNGELYISKSPYIFSDEGNFIFIDTTKKASEFDNTSLKAYDTNNKGNVMFIFKDKMIISQQFRENQEIKYSDLGNLEFNKSSAISLINALKWVSIFIVLFLIVGMFLGHMFSGLIVGVFALLISAFMKVKLKFSNTYKLSIYALTLPTIVDVIRSSLALSVPHFYKIYILGATIYMIFVIKIIKDHNEAVEDFREF
ncbi:hypothetical protein CPJCM30710_20410 [Clostridium polyendosporum]|uniref:DUF1189 domain-containing protein n=1 Tax=Clostridium polyendosporum TaxID=69208 RepID=A0A919RZF0_9CLOT|nr:DUF1189 domain-containing protein [Clostridium polyendosporum]GIM29375.1 hypothetical protein CPJCM30710_20410 [Clostridium polyendosporum]